MDGDGMDSAKEIGMNLTHVVTLAGRDSSSGHRKFTTRRGLGSVKNVSDAERYTQADAEALADEISARGGFVPWCAEPADADLPDW
jgi:hypothetical protein